MSLTIHQRCRATYMFFESWHWFAATKWCKLLSNASKHHTTYRNTPAAAFY